MNGRLTQKQENFCTNIVLECMTQHDAYIAAYNTGKMLPDSIDRNAFALINSTKITSRIDDLRAETRLENVLNLQERQEILSEIGRGKVAQFVDETGNIDHSTLDSHAVQAIDEQSIMGKMGTIVKLKLHNPMTAIDLLNKMDKVYSEGITLNDNRVVFNITVKDQETKELLESSVERTKKLEVGNG